MTQTMDFRIREIETGHDIMEVNRLAGIIWHESYRSILSREQIAYMIEKYQSVRALTEQLAFDGYRYLLLEESDEAVGYCGVQVKDGKMYLSKMYLLSRVRGKGYFRRVVEYLDALCRHEGVTAIWLTVNRHNEHAIDVYRHLGFEELRTQVADIGNGYVMDDYVLERTVVSHSA